MVEVAHSMDGKMIEPGRDRARSRRGRAALACALAMGGMALAAAPASGGSVVAQSDFTNGAQGWKVKGDPIAGSPFHFATGGNPGGYLSTTDAAQNKDQRWHAPGRYLGNRESSYGTDLSFDLRQSENDDQDPNTKDIRLKGDGTLITLDIGNPNTAPTWSEYDIELVEDGWVKRNGGPVSEGLFTRVLRDLSLLQIKAEYQEGEDTDDIDNVILRG
jgi:hypothetical protein